MADEVIPVAKQWKICYGDRPKKLDFASVGDYKRREGTAAIITLGRHATIMHAKLLGIKATAQLATREEDNRTLKIFSNINAVLTPVHDVIRGQIEPWNAIAR